MQKLHRSAYCDNTSILFRLVYAHLAYQRMPTRHMTASMTSINQMTSGKLLLRSIQFNIFFQFCFACWNENWYYFSLHHYIIIVVYQFIFHTLRYQSHRPIGLRDYIPAHLKSNCWLFFNNALKIDTYFLNISIMFNVL
jgi:type IV secretory pathway VirB6-like protein